MLPPESHGPFPHVDDAYNITYLASSTIRLALSSFVFPIVSPSALPFLLSFYILFHHTTITIHQNPTFSQFSKSSS